MDPVSHAAFGRALVALDRRGLLGSGAVAACVAASLAPDVDAIYMPFGWDVYLRQHQGGTHSVVGTIACAVLVAVSVRALLKRGRYLPLFLAAWAGAAGHVLLDVISGADIRFFWPVGPSAALPLFAMADPWLGGLLVIGLVLLTLRKQAAPGIAVATIAAVVILAGGKAVLYARTHDLGPGGEGAARFRRAEVEWGSLTRWTIYETRAEAVESFRVDAVTRAVTPLLRVSRGLDEPLVEESRELSTVKNFRAAHRVTFAIVTGTGAAPRRVLWSDLRYCGPPARGTTPWSPIALGSASPVACALWFGGEFDAATGVPTDAIVYVGHLLQARPAH